MLNELRDVMKDKRHSTMMYRIMNWSSYECAAGNGSGSLTLYVFKPTDVQKYSNEKLNT